MGICLIAPYAKAEGPIESLQCVSRAVYWEARGEPMDTMIQEAEYLLDISKSGRPGIKTPCDAVHLVSIAYKDHAKDVPKGDAWDEAQQASIAAWTNPKLDDSGGAGAYFIDIQRLTRPGYSTQFVEQKGNVLFFKEVQTSK